MPVIRALSIICFWCVWLVYILFAGVSGLWIWWFTEWGDVEWMRWSALPVWYCAGLRNVSMHMSGCECMAILNPTPVCSSQPA